MALAGVERHQPPLTQSSGTSAPAATESRSASHGHVRRTARRSGPATRLRPDPLFSIREHICASSIRSARWRRRPPAGPGRAPPRAPPTMTGPSRAGPCRGSRAGRRAAHSLRRPAARPPRRGETPASRSTGPGSATVNESRHRLGRPPAPRPAAARGPLRLYPDPLAIANGSARPVVVIRVLTDQIHAPGSKCRHGVTHGVLSIQ